MPKFTVSGQLEEGSELAEEWREFQQEYDTKSAALRTLMRRGLEKTEEVERGGGRDMTVQLARRSEQWAIYTGCFAIMALVWPFVASLVGFTTSTVGIIKAALVLGGSLSFVLAAGALVATLLSVAARSDMSIIDAYGRSGVVLGPLLARRRKEA